MMGWDVRGKQGVGSSTKGHRGVFGGCERGWLGSWLVVVLGSQERRDLGKHVPADGRGTINTQIQRADGSRNKELNDNGG